MVALCSFFVWVRVPSSVPLASIHVRFLRCHVPYCQRPVCTPISSHCSLSHSGVLNESLLYVTLCVCVWGRQADPKIGVCPDSAAKDVFALFFVLTALVPVSRLIRGIVHEKETRIREGMKMMVRVIAESRFFCFSFVGATRAVGLVPGLFGVGLELRLCPCSVLMTWCGVVHDVVWCRAGHG